MPNPLFNEFGGGGVRPQQPTQPQNGGFNMQNFMQFVNQHQGQNPQQIVQSMLQSGQLSQEQFNSLSQKASSMMQMYNMFRGF